MPTHTPLFNRVEVDELLINMKMPVGLCDLDNDVHRLLARDKFKPEFDYEAFLPVFRALTLIFETESIKRYILAVFFSKHEQFPDPKSPNGRYFRMCLSQGPLTAQDHTMAEECLLHLANAFSGVEVTHLPSGMLGATIPTESVCVASGWMMPPKGARMPGKSSSIQISARHYWHIVQTYRGALEMKARANRPQQQYPMRLMRLYLRTLALLIHEFGHFCQDARMECSTDPERALNGRAICEAGCDLETLVFGGVIQRWDYGRGSDDRFRLIEWPSDLIKAAYLHHNAKIWVDTEQAPREPGVSMHWAIPDSWIVRLFLRSSWAKRDGGEALLRPPKILGLQTAGPVCVCRIHPQENLLRADTGRPVDWSEVTQPIRTRLIKRKNPQCKVGVEPERAATSASVPLGFARHVDGTVVEEAFRAKLSQIVAQQEADLAEQGKGLAPKEERRSTHVGSSDCKTH
ncbi:hypothetical protein Tdes44962_MAKER01330 [Teratosphaeria destructans]|uniref:Uncharacterized protein n=1 Tax=Teratosphaeria destructans TaxID=418781 RepID=A0A9W7T053_9PEZI|nr:hypothetical protein Tdes44962_MAKER01330 [Teratosphaeria destructans]